MLETIILGIVVGKIRGGQFQRLGTSLLRFSWLIFLSFALQLGISIMISLGHSFVTQYRMSLYVISYLMLFAALFLNMQFKCMWLIMIGAITNFAAIMLNGGSMPIDIGILQRYGFENMFHSISMEALPQYIPLEEAGIYTGYLGKRLSMPAIYPLKQIFSVGDLLILMGIFFLIQKMMTPSIYNRASNVIRFDHKKRAFKR